MDKIEQQIVDYVDKHADEFTEFLKDVVKIPSITGHEKEVQGFLLKKLSGLGFDAKFMEPDIKKMFEMFPEVAQIPSIGEPGLDMPLMTDDKFTYSQLMESEYDRLKSYKDRPNVIALLKGKGKGRSLIMNGHVDAVPVGDRSRWKHDPFGAEIEDGNLYGRGAVDMKGGVAAMICAAETLVKSGISLSGDLMLQCVVNEEHAGGGSLGCVAEGLTADAAIVTEPTGPGQLVLNGSGGGVYWEIKIKGKETHAGSRWRNGKQYGISAVEKAACVLESLMALERDLNKDEILMSMCAGKIEGGTYATATALECKINGVAYFSPHLGTGKEGIIKVKRLLKEAVLKTGDPWLKENPPVIKFQHYDDAYLLPENKAEIKDLVISSICDVLGKKAKVSTLAGGCDARHLGNQGNIPTVVYGPGDMSMAHSTDEYVGVADYIDSIKVLACAVYRWCK